MSRKGASLLDSAPSDSSDDSGQVLATLPSRLGGTAIGDFGGRSCCTFRSDLRSSSDNLPGLLVASAPLPRQAHDSTAAHTLEVKRDVPAF